ncbi:glycosyltransferase family 2 protein [Flavobacterium sp. UMI-01]|uniref:glycosyltransferase family 2 protein n=1 Tax=Flavobacterium sp. UMI-01 TaxID=1441053 RepID=UPI001C7DD86D|nr:glycosyltransferase family 2 protein [Flavobacterium sp. UMI-01]GIZ08726.1 beta 1,4 glucosyltransferase [Flavobacterium sp. UMI-01]
MKPKITALTLTFNNELTLEKHLNNLAFADEIIVIDAYSNDKTTAIAQAQGATIIQHKWEDDVEQRKFAVEQATHDWVVFFDIEEQLSEDLTKEIIEKLSDSHNTCSAFKVKRNFIFQHQKIAYGNWQEAWAIKIFNKKNCFFSTSNSSEKILTKGTLGTLKSVIDYNAYSTFDSYNHKLNKSSLLEAKVLYSQKKKPHFYHFLIQPFLYFFYHYIIRLGFLDGKKGYILAYIHSFSVFKRYLQLWMMYRKLE